KSAREENRGPVALAKETSNLFRDREAGERRRLDVRAFNQVLSVREAFVEAEGMIPYEDLTSACLQHGVMPAVVPQLKTITLGGAVAGVGIESSSHRQGLVHDTMLELDVLLGDGRIVNCTAHNAHSDLFFGFPNSYGTLGYALRVKAKLFPAKRYVVLTHIRHRDPGAFFRDLADWCARPVDFVDGVVFGPDEMYLVIG